MQSSRVADTVPMGSLSLTPVAPGGDPPALPRQRLPKDGWFLLRCPSPSAQPPAWAAARRSTMPAPPAAGTHQPALRARDRHAELRQPEETAVNIGKRDENPAKAQLLNPSG